MSIKTYKNEKGFKWLFVGSGRIAKIVAKNIMKIKGHSISGVYSPTYANACDFGKMFDAKVYQTLNDALDEGDFDCVYINSLNHIHYQNAMECILRGKNVLCEKPVCVNVRETKEIFKLAAENNVYFAEAMWTWFTDGALRVKEWMTKNEIGKPKKVEITFSNGHNIRKKDIKHVDRLLDPNKAGGALLDIGVYAVHYAYQLFGMPDRIECRGDVVGGVDFTEEIDLYYKDFVCNLFVSIDEFRAEDALITGTDGKIIVRDFHAAQKVELYIYKDRSEIFTEEYYDNDPYDLFVHQMARVAEEIQSGKKTSDYVTPRSSIEVMEIMDECRRQMGVVFPFDLRSKNVC